MAKPGRREHNPSEKFARFTDRDDHRRLFRFHLTSPTEPPALMFYGIGGAGKTWLLKKLRQEVPAGVPTASSAPATCAPRRCLLPRLKHAPAISSLLMGIGLPA